MEPRFGINSIWHLFISLLNIKIFNLKLIYLFNYLPIVVLINELFEKKKKYYIADVFLFLTLSFIFFFSLLHPFGNGVILNLIGSPEVDTVAMVLFILSLYLFLKYFLDKKREYFNLILIVATLAYLTKISHLSAVLFAIIVFLSDSNIKIFTRLNIFILLLNIFWAVRSIILSGCVIFPAKITCLKKLYWGHPIENVERTANSWTSFSRDTRLRLRAGDFDHTIYSYDWVKPWINDYLLNTALFNAIFFVLIFSLILLLIKFIFKLNYKKIPFQTIFLFPIYIISLYIWFKNPDIRLGLGTLITFSTIILAITSNLVFLEKYFYKYSLYTLSFLLFFMVIKNYDNKNLIFSNNDKFAKNYGHITKIQKTNNYDVYSPEAGNFCYDFKKICVVESHNNYVIKNKNGYFVFLRN